MFCNRKHRSSTQNLFTTLTLTWNDANEGMTAQYGSLLLVENAQFLKDLIKQLSSVVLLFLPDS